MNEDHQHLDLLSVFHYVVGGLAGLVACIPLIHFVMGLAMTLGWFPNAEPPMRAFGIVLMAIASVVILAGWAFAVLLIMAGRYLRQRRHYTFCLVMAAIACVFTPFGTVLGVFSIIVLMRPSVKPLFEPAKASEGLKSLATS